MRREKELLSGRCPWSGPAGRGSVQARPGMAGPLPPGSADGRMPSGRVHSWVYAADGSVAAVIGEPGIAFERAG